MMVIRNPRALKLFQFACALLLIIAVFRLYFVATDDIRVSNFTYELPFNSKWEVSSPSPEQKALIDKILSQNFTYLGKGAQSYAFESQDQKFVLKFFKFKHIKPSWFVRTF